jgi:hypothetical protein
MKHLLIALALISTNALAHTITGQMVLKGTAKTKVMIQGSEVKCNIKIDEIKNNLIEDSFGNPAYRVWTKIDLASSFSATTPIKYKLDVRFTNIHQTTQGRIVRDDLYVGEDVPRARMTVNEKGRIKQVVFPIGAEIITCNF